MIRALKDAGYRQSRGSQLPHADVFKSMSDCKQSRWSGGQCRHLHHTLGMPASVNGVGEGVMSVHLKVISMSTLVPK